MWQVKKKVDDMELWSEVMLFNNVNTVLIMPSMPLKWTKLLWISESESGFVSLV